ncbi:MAG: CHY zinc finger protein [Spartobacteria bacterium]
MPTKGKIDNVNVIGVDVDNETRCAHYHDEHDIIALKFKCCGKWFSCHRCHAGFSEHPAQVWAKKDFDTPAILCGGCGHQLTIREYLDCNSVCPRCRRFFNPGCANHYHFYFES